MIERTVRFIARFIFYSSQLQQLKNRFISEKICTYISYGMRKNV